MTTPDTTPTERLPETFEEWVEIHGEPEYIGEQQTLHNNRIEVVDCTTDKPGDIPEDIEDIADIMWRDDKGKWHINYPKFTDIFAAINKYVYCHGAFFSPDGLVSCERIRQDISYSISDRGWTDRLDIPTNSIFNSLKDRHCVDELPVDANVIPLKNGDLHISGDVWQFRLGEKKQAPYRLAVDYVPFDRPMPLFGKWLRDVFEPEDIPVVQEIMGYCLVPVTAAQEAFFLVGDAGVGKSGLGTVLQGLLGGAYEVAETQELVTARFQVAKLEGKLVVYDDDLGSAALSETGLLKKLITADQNIPAERKYGDPYSFRSYCRIVASANFMLSSLYDDSDGFYRRLHPILVKNLDPKRKNIRGFYDMILEQEREQILRWALEGLRRVIGNGWRISWSERSRAYMGQVKSQGTHFGEFFDDVLEISADGAVSASEIKKLYARWCRENAVTEASERRLERWFSDNAEKRGYRRGNHIPRGGKQVRGFTGISIRSGWEDVPGSIIRL